AIRVPGRARRGAPRQELRRNSMAAGHSRASALTCSPLFVEGGDQTGNRGGSYQDIASASRKETGDVTNTSPNCYGSHSTSLGCLPLVRRRQGEGSRREDRARNPCSVREG